MCKTCLKNKKHGFSLSLSSCARLWFKGCCEGSLVHSVVATSLIHVVKKTEGSTLHVLLPKESPEISKFTRGQREKTETPARSIIHTHTKEERNATHGVTQMNLVFR